MLELATEIAIDAPAPRVWSLLVDFASYPKWNPLVRSVEGSPVVGRSLKVFIRPPDGMGMVLRPTLLVMAPNRELRWRCKLVMPGLFDGEHHFTIEEQAGRGVVFHHGERFSGILVPFFKNTLNGTVRRGFVAMNEALKREAERAPMTSSTGP
jgi:hypothetical protein